MSERQTTNRLIKIINRVVAPHLWESGYVARPGPGHVWLWAPRKPKLFRRNTVIKEVECLGHGWISMDGYGGGMVRTPMQTLPNADLVAVLEWLLAVLPNKPKGT